MALQVRRQERETSQGLVRRFGQRFQRSGILNRAKKLKFFRSPKSETAKKKSALRREQMRKEFEMQQKMAKPE